MNIGYWILDIGYWILDINKKNIFNFISISLFCGYLCIIKYCNAIHFLFVP